MRELLTVPEAAAGPGRIEWECCAAGGLERRFTVHPEPGAAMTCHLLLLAGPPPPAVLLCLQGHTSGMHLSLDRPRDARDAELDGFPETRGLPVWALGNLGGGTLA